MTRRNSHEQDISRYHRQSAKPRLWHHTSTGTVYFVSAEKEVPFPEHAHAAQWTVVVSGKCLFTANGETKTYQQGETYFIPAGLKHQITLCPGYSEVDYVDDPLDGEI